MTNPSNMRLEKMTGDKLLALEIIPNKISRDQIRTYYYAVIFADEDTYTPVILERNDFETVLNKINEKYFEQAKYCDNNEEESQAQANPNQLGCVFHVAFCYRLSTCILSSYTDPLLKKFNFFHGLIRNELNKFLNAISTPNPNVFKESIKFKIEKPYCQWYDNCLFMDPDSKQYASNNEELIMLKRAFNYFLSNNHEVYFTGTQLPTKRQPIVICSGEGKCNSLNLMNFYTRATNYTWNTWRKFRPNYTCPLYFIPGMQEIVDSSCLIHHNVCKPITMYVDNSGVFRAQQNFEDHFITFGLNGMHRYFVKLELEMLNEMLAIARTKPFSIIPRDAPGFSMKLKSKIMTNSNNLTDILKANKYVVGTKEMVVLMYTAKGYMDSGPIEFIFSNDALVVSSKKPRIRRSTRKLTEGTSFGSRKLMSFQEETILIDNRENVSGFIYELCDCEPEEFATTGCGKPNNSFTTIWIIISIVGILLLVGLLLGHSRCKNSTDTSLN